MSLCPNGTTSCPKPLTFLPLPNNTVFTDNSINFVNKDTKNSNHLDGIYIITSSSYFDDKTLPFNAFNNDYTFWKSNNSENYYIFPSSEGKKTSYNTPPYAINNSNTLNNSKTISNYQGGSAPSQVTNYFTTSTDNKNIPNIDGEWLQIQLPQPIILSSYSISTPFDNNLQYFPAKFTVVGSNDGGTWTIIDSSDNTTVSNSDIPRITKTNPSITFSINNNTKQYYYYRLILEAMQNNVTCVRITQWKLVGLQPKENFIGYMNHLNPQYSYYNFNPSLNTFSNFAISQPTYYINNFENFENNKKENNNDNYCYEKICSAILFTLLSISLIHIFVKSKKM
jgi:hypothetical protein